MTEVKKQSYITAGYSVNQAGPFFMQVSWKLSLLARAGQLKLPHWITYHFGVTSFLDEEAEYQQMSATKNFFVGGKVPSKIAKFIISH